MRYRVGFEASIADFDMSRADSPLILHRDGATQAIELPEGNGYEAEVRHILEAVIAGADRIDPSLAEASQVLRILEAEGASIDSQKPITL
jgi:predicted dehydrogenase